MLSTLRKLFGKAMLAALLVTAMVVTPALASTATPATNMKDATGPLSGVMQIEPGVTHWYKFKYTYDNSKNSNEPTQAIVELAAQMNGAVNFEVWTPERLRAPLRDENTPDDVTVRAPVGVGSPLYMGETYHREGPAPQHKHYVPILDGLHMMWVGSAAATDTYYIAVTNKTDTVQSYELMVAGPDVSF
jgi:hypothetical protein